MSFQVLVDALDAEREVTREVIEDLRQQNHDLREQEQKLVEALRGCVTYIGDESLLVMVRALLAPYDTKAPTP